jgi:hypothetical protein
MLRPHLGQCCRLQQSSCWPQRQLLDLVRPDGATLRAFPDDAVCVCVTMLMTSPSAGDRCE